MDVAGAPLLTAWGSFYVITGTSATVLTGLMFVVVTLISDERAPTPAGQVQPAIQAFATPTVVHGSAVLLVSALLSAPWPALWLPGLLLGLAGLAGVAYAVIVVVRMYRFPGYAPDSEDWLWYGALPLVAYAALAGAGWLLGRGSASALFGLAAVAVALLFLAIRNAWDTVTFIALMRRQALEGGSD